MVAILKSGKGPRVMPRADMGGLPVEEKSAIVTNHSPLFRVAPETTIRTGVETSMLALMDLLKK